MTVRVFRISRKGEYCPEFYKYILYVKTIFRLAWPKIGLKGNFYVLKVRIHTFTHRLLTVCFVFSYGIPRGLFVLDAQESAAWRRYDDGGRQSG